MSSGGSIPLRETAQNSSAPGAAEAPSFAPLPTGAAFRRVCSNLAVFFSASPQPVPNWAFAPMFRSAYFRRAFPARSLLASALLHVGFLACLINLPSLPTAPRIIVPAEFVPSEHKIIWYTKSDLLPPVSPLEPERRARRERKTVAAAERPAFHPVQTIISRPPKPDNTRQTLIEPAAPRLQIPTEVRIPNIVSPQPAIVPPPPLISETKKQLAQIAIPRLPTPAVAAPAPVPPKLSFPEVSIPALRASELPKLPVPEPPPQPQRKPAPAPAPPAVVPDANPTVLPNLVAVGVAPAPPPEEGEIRVPVGNRAGEFAVSPEGTERTAAPPGHPEQGKAAGANGPPQLDGRSLAEIRVPYLSIAGGKAPDILGPPVVPAPEARAVSPPSVPLPPPSGDLKKLLAKATRPALFPEMTRGDRIGSGFFGNKHVYTLYINMPNLSSGSGSWILRFAELENDGKGPQDDMEITSPVAVKKVDPQYVPSAIRDRVEGTVTLAAQILRDGTVSNVQVVQSLDARLDLSAVGALTLWRFQPGRKKGVPVDLEVLVQIPFRLPGF